MKAVWFILKLGLKILAAPLVLALALFTWVCFGLLYVSSFIFGLASTVVDRKSTRLNSSHTS